MVLVMLRCTRLPTLTTSSGLTMSAAATEAPPAATKRSQRVSLCRVSVGMADDASTRVRGVPYAVLQINCNVLHFAFSGGSWSCTRQNCENSHNLSLLLKTSVNISLAHLLPATLQAPSSDTLMVTSDQVQAALQQHLEATDVTVIDNSGGCGTAFDVAVVSAQFEGKRLLERHRLVCVCVCVCIVDQPRPTPVCHQVNAALKDLMPDIHALSIKRAWTPAQQQQHTAS